ncbi:MAG: hypothetical protein ACI4SH_01915 [Candidatus Scatosoma sp.]
MRFRNSLRLLMENFGNVYKMLLYKLAVTVVFAALSAALIVPKLTLIFASEQWVTFVSDIKSFIKAVAGGDTAFLQGFKDGFTGEGGTVERLLLFLKDIMPSLVWALLGVVFFYLLKRVADTLCNFTVGSMLNDKMSTYAETSFTGAFVKNLGRSWQYSLVYVPLMFVYNVAIIALCYFLFFYLLQLISFQPLLLSLFLTVTFIVVAEALKMTLTGLWLPSMTAGGERLGKAMRLKGKISPSQFKKIFSAYIVSVYLIILVNVAGALVTIGSILLLTIPASYFLLICVQYVNYYTVTGRKYFLAYDRVFDDPSRGDSVHYLNAVGDAERAKENGSAAESGATLESGASPESADKAENGSADGDKTRENGAE